MHKKVLLIAAMSLAIFSCNKSETQAPAPEASSEQMELVMKGGGKGTVTCPPVTYCGETTTVRLLAGQHIESGNLLVGNDGTNLYVTYTTTGGWKMSELHLFAGACGSIPVTNSGNPSPGQFPNKVSFSGSGVTSYTFTVPLSSLGCEGDICVAAHAVVKNGGQSETAWGEGCRINEKGNWAMRVAYTLQSCD